MWDNPFGMFPPKEKKGKKHQKHASLDGAKGTRGLGVDPAVSSGSRPHTSQGHRKADPSRPSTSHGTRHSPPPESPRLPLDSEMPLKKRPPGFDRELAPPPNPGQTSLLSRPTPMRSIIQPTPDSRDPTFQQYGSVDPYSYDQQNPPGPSYGQQSNRQAVPAPQDHRPQPTMEHRQQPHQPRRQSFDQDACRGLPLHKPMSNQSQHGNVEMPNFDAVSPPLNETTFESAPTPREQPAYAKKSYQTLGQAETKRPRPPPLEESAVSPLDAFAFDLPQNVRSGPPNLPQQSHHAASPVRYDNPPLSNAPARYDNPPMRYDNPPQATAPAHYETKPQPTQYRSPPQPPAPVPARYESAPQPPAHSRYDNPPPLSPGPINAPYNQRAPDPRVQTQQLPPRTASKQQTPQSPFPPRGASRADKDQLFSRPGQSVPNDSGYWQASVEQMNTRPNPSGTGLPRGPKPVRPGSREDHTQGYGQGRDDYGQRNRQGSRDDYAPAYDQGYGQEQASARPPFDRDPYSDPGNPYRKEQQYGQNYQGQSPPRGAPVAGDYGSGRPHTANSAHPIPVRDYGDRAAGPQNPHPDMPPVAGSFGDRPVPFRPGLAQANAGRSSPAARMQQSQIQAPSMQQAPPPQQAQPQPPPPQEASGAAPTVTVAELNNLRENFKNNPNDGALGLRFAKRLVEAASVLSSEHGRADPKQTAKNRERYIFDATKVVKRLVSSNYPDAMFYLADCYGQGLLGLPVEPKEAFTLYQSAAKLNHPQSAYRVAVCCELGNEEGGGTRRDPLKAMQWYKRAATLGDTPAMYKMGMIQLKGLLTQPRDPRQAVSWLKRAAERADKDNPHALHELGLLFESANPADHILRDEKYAFQLFSQAADLGYKYSQFRLGSAYEYGLLGLQIDARQSIAWYTRAAAQGEHQSELALSGWYLTGAEPLLQQSDQEAYLWARKAAQSGLAKAEYAMGYFTETGIGMTGGRGEIEEAKRWYYRAAGEFLIPLSSRFFVCVHVCW